MSTSAGRERKAGGGRSHKKAKIKIKIYVYKTTTNVQQGSRPTLGAVSVSGSVPVSVSVLGPKPSSAILAACDAHKLTLNAIANLFTK